MRKAIVAPLFVVVLAVAGWFGYQRTVVPRQQANGEPANETIDYKIYLAVKELSDLGASERFNFILTDTETGEMALTARSKAKSKS